MRRPAIISVWLLAFMVLSVGAWAAEEPVDLELVLAVDVSGSMDFEEAKLQREGYVAALAHPKVIDAITHGPLGHIAVIYVEWAGFQHKNIAVDWTLIGDETSARTFSQALSEAPLTRGRLTSISGAIEFAMPLFDDNSFDGTRRVIDISGDGPNNNGTLVVPARDRAAARRVTVNGLPIVNGRLYPFGRRQLPDLDLYYVHCVIGGPGAFVVVAEDFTSFAAAILKKLILEIAGMTPPPAERPAATPVRHVSWLQGAERSWGAARYSPIGPGIHPVSEGYAPGCDVGERRFRQYFQNRFDMPF